MAALQEGDADAFSVLYRRHIKGLLNFFWRLCWDKALAEDLTHDTILRVFRMAHQWEERAKFTTFLYRVARNLWIDHVRSAPVRKRRGSLDAPLGDEGGTFVDLLESSVESPSARLESGEREREIMDAVARLPEEQRIVFVLTQLQDLRYQDVAEILDVPLGTVKSRMHAAVAKLQAMLGHLVDATGEHEQ
jgi:RNA polymerase sigma-70 factor (ECF subfamily)